ncbi:hypothetical protein PC128_g27246 [Phytophthora cactorum]|nr:hypothetical protein PC128_g27246 [Phytophthora cactorum]
MAEITDVRLQRNESTGFKLLRKDDDGAGDGVVRACSAMVDRNMQSA